MFATRTAIHIARNTPIRSGDQVETDLDCSPIRLTLGPMAPSIRSKSTARCAPISNQCRSLAQLMDTGETLHRLELFSLGLSHKDPYENDRKQRGRCVEAVREPESEMLNGR